MENQSGLFEVRITEEGKKHIRKISRVTYAMLGIVILVSCATIYLQSYILVQLPQPGQPLIVRISPYISIGLSIVAMVSNFYYLRFANILLREIEAKNEPGANAAFAVLWKGILVFLIALIMQASQLVLTFIFLHPW